MRNVLLTTIVAAAVLAAAETARAGTALPSSPFEYAIFALDRVVIGQSAVVDPGDVGVNSSSGEVQMRARARIAGSAAAGTISPGRNARIDGAMFCNTGPVGAPGCSVLTLPLVDTSAFPIVTVEAGNDDVKLGPKLATQIAPGKYGKVRLGAKSRLRLEPGVYTFRSIGILRGASLLCDGACTIGVRDTVEVGEGAVLSTTEPVDATQLRIDIQFGAVRRAALRGNARSRVDATVYAPNGIIRLGTNGRYTGAFVAREVEILQRARLSAPQP